VQSGGFGDGIRLDMHSPDDVRCGHVWFRRSNKREERSTAGGGRGDSTLPCCNSVHFLSAIEGVVNANWRQKVLDRLAALGKPETQTAGHSLTPPTVPKPAPEDRKRTGYGYCMNCAAVRSYDAPKCAGCSSTGPVIGDAPAPASPDGG
jgi:hypothetical protein